MNTFRSWLPLGLMTTLILALGAYAAIHQDAFLTKYNLGNLLLTAMPLALVGLGQTVALLVGGFDISVAALMTMCVVTASFTLQPDMSWPVLFLGALALIGVGLATGIFNATLIRVLKLPSIIATLGTLSILEGASLLLRDHPEGFINSDVVDALNTASVSSPTRSSASSCSPCWPTSGSTGRAEDWRCARWAATRPRHAGSG